MGVVDRGEGERGAQGAGGDQDRAQREHQRADGAPSPALWPSRAAPRLGRPRGGGPPAVVCAVVSSDISSESSRLSITYVSRRAGAINMTQVRRKNASASRRRPGSSPQVARVAPRDGFAASNSPRLPIPVTREPVLHPQTRKDNTHPNTSGTHNCSCSHRVGPRTWGTPRTRNNNAIKSSARGKPCDEAACYTHGPSFFPLPAASARPRPRTSRFRDVGSDTLAELKLINGLICCGRCHGMHEPHVHDTMTLCPRLLSSPEKHR